MFPLQSAGMVHKGPSLISEEDEFWEDLLVDCAPIQKNHNNYNNINKNKNNDQGVKKRQRNEINQETKDKCSNDHQLRKSMHREIEKQRRQVMSGSYASLRSLLPLQYIKGKRAVTDQLHQAAIYINHMQNKIKELQVKTDKLKKLSSLLPDLTDTTNNENPKSNIISDSRNYVKVNLCKDGVEILISNSYKEEISFPLSKVLEDLLEGDQQLTVITCVSTRVDEWSLYKIQIEVNDPTSIDLSKLQKRLLNVIIKHA